MSLVTLSSVEKLHQFEVDEIVLRLNRQMVGWSNYFKLGPVSPSYKALDFHACYRLREWLRAKQ